MKIVSQMTNQNLDSNTSPESAWEMHDPIYSCGLGIVLNDKVAIEYAVSTD